MAHYPKVNTGINYRSYVAQLSQTGTDAPVAIVLHNDLGYTPTWSRTNPGNYQLTAGAANIDFANENNEKVVVFLNIGNYPSGPMEFGYIAHAVWSREENRVFLNTAFYDGSTTQPGYAEDDGLLSEQASPVGDDFWRASFELRIYS